MGRNEKWSTISGHELDILNREIDKARKAVDKMIFS